MNQAIDYHAILPEMILSGTLVLVLIADAFLSREPEVADDAARVPRAWSRRSSRPCR